MNLRLKEKRQETNYASQERTVKIAVATDLHYLSSKLTDNGEFFTKLIDSADGKNMYYIEEITETFVETMIKEKPEILILSGDLTFNGEKESHLDLEKKLARIQNNGTKILVMPGNHDVDRSSAAGFYGDGYRLVDSVSKDEFATIYQKYGLKDALQKDQHSLSYVYKARNDFWILMLDSNSQEENTVSDQTYNWLETILKEAEKKGVKLLTVSHQTILAHNPDFKTGFMIQRASQLDALYQRYHVLANLSGHIHIQHIADSGLTEIVTSALPVSPHHYAFLEFNGKTLTYQTHTLNVEEWAKTHQLTDPTLLSFTEKSKEFLEKVARSKAQEDMVDTKLTQQEKEQMLETFAQLNAAYFAGIKVDENDYQMGLELWQEKGSPFYQQYLETILESTKKDYNHLTIRVK